MEKTINELLEAFKKSYEAQSSLVKAKDAMINFLEAHIDELKLELSQYKNKQQSSTGLTDEELEEIEKLTEEIMKTRAFGILDDSKENTTTENSDVIHSIELVNCGLTKDLIDALNQRLSNRDTV